MSSDTPVTGRERERLQNLGAGHAPERYGQRDGGGEKNSDGVDLGSVKEPNFHYREKVSDEGTSAAGSSMHTPRALTVKSIRLTRVALILD